jgi:hypothetical protein
VGERTGKIGISVLWPQAGAQILRASETLPPAAWHLFCTVSLDPGVARDSSPGAISCPGSGFPERKENKRTPEGDIWTHPFFSFPWD